MKKNLLIVAIAGLAFASCAKDRTCTCTVTTTPVSGATITSTEVITVKKVTVNQAMDGACKSGYTQQTAPTSGVKQDIECTIK